MKSLPVFFFTLLHQEKVTFFSNRTFFLSSLTMCAALSDKGSACKLSVFTPNEFALSVLTHCFYLEWVFVLSSASFGSRTLKVTSVYNLRFELKLPIRTSTLIFNVPNVIQLARKSTAMNCFIIQTNIRPNFQLVHPGKVADYQLDQSQNRQVLRYSLLYIFVYKWICLILT